MGDLGGVGEEPVVLEAGDIEGDGGADGEAGGLDLLVVVEVADLPQGSPRSTATGWPACQTAGRVI